MELTTIDFVIIGIILFLSIKGMVTGFTQEFLNFIGLIGGIAVASRVNRDFGKLISDNIYPIADEPTLKLVGFVATLFIVWILFNSLSSVLRTILSPDIDIVSRLLGFIMVSARYVAIFSMLIVGVESSTFLSEKLSDKYRDSNLLPRFIELGNNILNLDGAVNIATSSDSTTVSGTMIKDRDINLTTAVGDYGSR